MDRYDAYTLRQIRRAMAIEGISDANKGRVLASLSAMSPGTVERDDTIHITGDELREALRRQLREWRFKQDGGTSSKFTYVGLADLLLTDVMNHREREWKPGDLVQSAEDTIWLRTTDATWKRVGAEGTYPHTTPSRPLRLLAEGVKA